MAWMKWSGMTFWFIATQLLNKTKKKKKKKYRAYFIYTATFWVGSRFWSKVVNWIALEERCSLIWVSSTTSTLERSFFGLTNKDMCKTCGEWAKVINGGNSLFEKRGQVWESFTEATASWFATMENRLPSFYWHQTKSWYWYTSKSEWYYCCSSSRDHLLKELSEKEGGNGEEFNL